MEFTSLIRPTLLWCLLFVPVGLIAAVVMLLLTPPVYRARALVEVQGVNTELVKNATVSSASYESSQTNLDTSITLLEEGPFRDRVRGRLQGHPPAVEVPAPFGTFGVLRQRLTGGQNDLRDFTARAIDQAGDTFVARPINGTRIIELLCSSEHPTIAAAFLNEIAEEFLQDSVRERNEHSRTTDEWLSQQIEQARIRVEDAERKLNAATRASGSVSTGAQGPSTLDETKLSELQRSLAAAQAERATRQATWELISKADPSLIPDIVHDETLRTYQSRRTDLRRELASMATTVTPQSEKYQRVKAQIDVLDSALQKGVQAARVRVQGEYEAALRREKLLELAYTPQAARVNSEQSRKSDLETLRHEVDTQRQTYRAVLMQQNEALMTKAAPVRPVRLVEKVAPPDIPYYPRNSVYLGLGVVGGISSALVVAFLASFFNRRVSAPGIAPALIDIPELGVIPPADIDRGIGGPRSRLRLAPPGSAQNGVIALWERQHSLFAESYRGLLVSLLPHMATGRPTTLIVSSAGGGEGKTLTAANLAVALAESGRRVILLDGDLRQQQLHELFGVDRGPGLSELMESDEQLTAEYTNSFLQTCSIPLIRVLAAGNVSGSPSALFHSPRLQELMQVLRNGADVVLVDSPPLLPVAATRVLARLADGLVLVVRSGVTSQEDLRQVYDMLVRDSISVFGLILNDYRPAGNPYNYFRPYNTSV